MKYSANAPYINKQVEMFDQERGRPIRPAITAPTGPVSGEWGRMLSQDVETTPFHRRFLQPIAEASLRLLWLSSAIKERRMWAIRAWFGSTVNAADLFRAL